MPNDIIKQLYDSYLRFFLNLVLLLHLMLKIESHYCIILNRVMSNKMFQNLPLMSLNQIRLQYRNLQVLKLLILCNKNLMGLIFDILLTIHNSNVYYCLLLVQNL